MLSKKSDDRLGWFCKKFQDIIPNRSLHSSLIARYLFERKKTKGDDFNIECRISMRACTFRWLSFRLSCAYFPFLKPVAGRRLGSPLSKGSGAVKITFAMISGNRTKCSMQMAGRLA